MIAAPSLNTQDQPLVPVVGTGPGNTGGVVPPISPRDNRIKNACTECKRRKVRCDGADPCYSCRWYKHPERCLYPRPAPRPSLTRKSLDTLRSRLDDATNVLKRLYPASTLEELIPLSRETLVALLNSQSGARNPSIAGASSSDGTSVSPGSNYVRRASKSPEAFEYDESVENLEGTEAVADDVNALSLGSDRTSSYVGASSATAGLRVLLNIAPEHIFTKQRNLAAQDASTRAVGSLTRTPGLISTTKAPRDPKTLVEAYFVRVHPTTPLLDEASFRSTFETGERKDSAWLALLHMVLALGAIAYTTSDSNEDIQYYRIAKSHIGLDSFGSGHIETLQALALMAGWYLHYRNRPNMASAIMGAVFRMANALGLHRELPGEETPQNKMQRELRRRIWWCLVVLDAGEATTLGRVSNTNIFGSGVNLPSNINDAGDLTTTPTTTSLLISDIEFSRQATLIQSRLISLPSLEFTETLALDAHLVYWHSALPPFLRSPNPCPESLLQPRATSKWRYLNLRIILHRPVLMEAALRRLPFAVLTPDQKVCVRKCQGLARELISSVEGEWTTNQYSGWPAVWYLFQASIIPLLSLYTFVEDQVQAEEWSEQVRKAIQLFREMEPWSIAARRTYELTSLLYEAHSESLNSSGLENSSATAEDETIMSGTDPGSTTIASAPLSHDPTTATTSALPNQQPGPQAQARNFGEWPMWEGLFNFPDLGFPESAFPDLYFPEMGPGATPGWDFAAPDLAGTAGGQQGQQGGGQQGHQGMQGWEGGGGVR